MPLYFFQLTDGEQVLDNHQGLDLPGDAAARDDALALARDQGRFRGEEALRMARNRVNQCVDALGSPA